MNVYDFDNTVFAGDSTFRFCLFAVKRSPRLLLKLPGVLYAYARYALGRTSKTIAKQTLYQALLPAMDDLPGALDAFWQKNIPRVKAWYMARRRPDDVIISASPAFLLRPACEKLGVKNLIASEVDPRSGDYFGLNCHGEEKVRRFRAACDGVPDAFFSDSMSDAPMARIARHAYRVRGDLIVAWPNDGAGAKA